MTSKNSKLILYVDARYIDILREISEIEGISMSQIICSMIDAQAMAHGMLPVDEMEEPEHEKPA